MAVWLIASSLSAWSQSSLYFNRNSFVRASQAVPGNRQSITDFGPFPYGPTVTVSDVTFSGSSLGPHSINSGPALFNFDSVVPLGIHFANGARAFGADFSSQFPSVSSFTATLSLDNGETFQFTALTDPNYAFFGFISSTPIRNLIFSDGGILSGPVNLHEELIGNIYMVTVIPEPSSEALLALGAALLLLLSLGKHRCITLTIGRS